jgi:hypothetical protein
VLFPLSACWWSKRKISACFFLILFFAGFQIPLSSAYTDSIEASPEEIWKAAEQVLTPHGISKSKLDKWQIKSKWIEDRVERKRKLFPLGGGPSMRQVYLRRYHIQIQLKVIDNSQTELSVKGIFQEKSVEALPQLTWRLVKPQLADYNVERDFFFRILRQLEANHA